MEIHIQYPIKLVLLGYENKSSSRMNIQHLNHSYSVCKWYVHELCYYKLTSQYQSSGYRSLGQVKLLDTELMLKYMWAVIS